MTVGMGQRLGDLVDDFCPRCRLLLNHAIASLVDGQVVKVVCQTCYTEHAFMHGREAKKKSGNPHATLFDQVLAKTGAASQSGSDSNPKKKAGSQARYISRHGGKPSSKKK